MEISDVRELLQRLVSDEFDFDSRVLCYDPNKNEYYDIQKVELDSDGDVLIVMYP